MITFSPTRLIKINTLGVARQKAGWFQSERTLFDFEIIFFTQESATFYLDHQKVDVKPGEALVIPPGTVHYSKPEDEPPSTYEFFHFETDAETRVASVDDLRRHIARSMDEASSRPTEYFASPESGNDQIWLDTIIKMGTAQVEIMDLFRKAMKERISPQINSSQLASLRVMEILALLTRCVWKELRNDMTATASQTQPALLQEAIFVMHERYESLCEIRNLAKIVGVTPQHLIRLFKKHLRTTPLEYLNRIKLNKAKKTLMHTNASIKEAAFASGFNSPHYFSRIFHKKEGCTPSEFVDNICRNKNQGS